MQSNNMGHWIHRTLLCSFSSYPIESMPSRVYGASLLNAQDCRVWSAGATCANKSSCANGICVPDSCPTSDCQVVGETVCGQGEYQVCVIDKSGCPKLGIGVKCRSGGVCSAQTGGCDYLKSVDDFVPLLKSPAGDGATALADALDNIVIGDTPLDAPWAM